MASVMVTCSPFSLTIVIVYSVLCLINIFTGKVSDPENWFEDISLFVPQDIEFTGTPGLQGAAAGLDHTAHPADFFELILTDELLQRIATETNLYAEHCIRQVCTEASPHSPHKLHTIQFKELYWLEKTYIYIAKVSAKIQ